MVYILHRSPAFYAKPDGRDFTIEEAEAPHEVPGVIVAYGLDGIARRFDDQVAWVWTPGPGKVTEGLISKGEWIYCRTF